MWQSYVDICRKDQASRLAEFQLFLPIASVRAAETPMPSTMPVAAGGAIRLQCSNKTVLRFVYSCLIKRNHSLPPKFKGIVHSPAYLEDMLNTILLHGG